MNAPARVELRLLGQTLTVRTEASPEYIRSLAAYVEERAATLQKSGVRDPLAALSLAAIDIADELFRAREDQSRAGHDVRARLDALLVLLDELTPPAASSGRAASSDTASDRLASPDPASEISPSKDG
jgi:cell division protein ZapA (FtsZ GTPase activity inhibitor)